MLFWARARSNCARYLNWITDQQAEAIRDVPFEEPVDAETKAKLSISVDELGLSGRAANCLRNANVKYGWRIAGLHT